MNKHYIISIISITLILLLSIHTVIGKNTQPTITPLNSPLFDKQHRTIYTKTSHSHYQTNYLGSTKNDSTHYHFIQKSPIENQTIYLLKKYISNHAIINVIIQNYQNKNPKDLPSQKLTLISKAIQRTSQSTDAFTPEPQLKSLIDPFSTVFPTCILLVIITILLLYSYILLFEVADFIFQVLENLF